MHQISIINLAEQIIFFLYNFLVLELESFVQGVSLHWKVEDKASQWVCITH